MIKISENGKVLGYAESAFISGNTVVTPDLIYGALNTELVTLEEVDGLPPTIAQIVAAMTALFDTVAQRKSYDNRITCALRAGYAGPFQAEGVAFASWMDLSNATAYTMLAEVQAETRPMPANVDEALALLPDAPW